MGNETAMASLEALREQARHDGRGRGGENGFGRGKPVEFGKDRALGLDALGQALLNEVDGVERVGKIGGDPYARRCRLGIVDEPLLGEVAQSLGHQGARLLGEIEPDIVERDIEGAACKHDRPGAADQTGSDDGDAILHIHSIFLLSARSSLNACEGPVQVTAPRSSTTVRSDRASARSRWWSTMIIATS